jgi:pimeloyl-ACP methyl ester carboxylesterase
MFFFQLPALPEWFMRRGDFRELGPMLRRTSRPGTFTDSDINVLKAALRQPGAVTAAVNYYRANVFSSLLRRGPRGAVEGATGGNGRVRVPTLFVYGEQDFAIIPETVRGVGDFVEAPYREVRLARANHWVQQEYPSEVNAALLSFLDEK